MLQNLALKTIVVLRMRRASRYIRSIVMVIRPTRIVMVTCERHNLVRAMEFKDLQRQHPCGRP
jgi:hypothetical protein